MIRDAIRFGEEHRVHGMNILASLGPAFVTDNCTNRRFGTA
jgi:hypothetical protein